MGCLFHMVTAWVCARYAFKENFKVTVKNIRCQKLTVKYGINGFFSRLTMWSMMDVQVTMARGGPYAALAMETKGTMVPYYASASELNAYWQSVFPKAPIPSPILDHFSAPSGISLSLSLSLSHSHPKKWLRGKLVFVRELIYTSLCRKIKDPMVLEFQSFNISCISCIIL